MTLSCVSSSEDGSFYVNPRNLISGIFLIYNLCDKPTDDATYKKLYNLLEDIDAYDDSGSVMEIDGIKITAMKSGKIKFTLSSSIAKLLQEKVRPFLAQYHYLFVDPSTIK
ncbi:hypothetical protein D3C78_1591640 [compost metagenome]